MCFAVCCRVHAVAVFLGTRASMLLVAVDTKSREEAREAHASTPPPWVWPGVWLAARLIHMTGPISTVGVVLAASWYTLRIGVVPWLACLVLLHHVRGPRCPGLSATPPFNIMFGGSFQRLNGVIAPIPHDIFEICALRNPCPCHCYDPSVNLRRWAAFSGGSL